MEIQESINIQTALLDEVSHTIPVLQWGFLNSSRVCAFRSLYYGSLWNNVDI